MDRRTRATRKRDRQNRKLITFQVGSPPPSPKRGRPVPIWPTTMLGTLVVIACLAIWLGGKAPADNNLPASTSVTSTP